MDDAADVGSQTRVGEAIATLIANLPAPVRDFVNGPDRDRIALELMEKYDLHADQAGEFERAYIRMLLGVDTPDEFTSSLRQAGVSEANISGLTKDVNELVFKPLRKKEQEGPAAGTPIQPIAQPSVREATPPPVAPVPTPISAPIPAAPAPIPQPTYAPPAPGAHQQTYWVPVSITAVPQPYMTTELPPSAYPQPVMAPPPAPPAPPPPVPAPSPVQEERPLPPPPIPQPTWQPAPPPNLPTHEEPRTPLVKDYAADPYREPPI